MKFKILKNIYKLTMFFLKLILSKIEPYYLYWIYN
jgi:hypothetical protein